MLATYIIQAILVTFYLFSILAIRLDWLPPPLQRSHTLSRTLLSVQHSTAEFLSASSIFSLSLLIASIQSVIQFNSINPTTWVLVLIIPLNSILPAIILQVTASSLLRRSKGRLLLWLFIGALTLFLAIKCYKVFGVTTINGISPCVEVSFVAIAVFAYTVSGVLVFGITAYVVDSIVSLVRNRPGVIARLPNMVEWGTVGASLCTMWFFIGWFVNLTIKIRSRTGDNNSDSQWTFGQVLALTTWIPFMVEFAYIWWEEPLQALNGRLMAPYEVVATSEQESLLAMESSRGDGGRGHFQRL